jgi:hypothetical protein
MNKFLMLVALSMLTLSAANASALPCMLSGDNPVDGTTVVSCGGLTFDNFGSPLGQITVSSAPSRPAGFFNAVLQHVAPFTSSRI